MPPLFVADAAEPTAWLPPAAPAAPVAPPPLVPPLSTDPLAPDDESPGLVAASAPDVVPPPWSPAIASPEAPLWARRAVAALLSCRGTVSVATTAPMRAPIARMNKG